MKHKDTTRCACGGALLLMLMFLLSAHGSALAQAGDTLLVKSSPVGNINVVIQGDTLPNGLRAHPNRVYKLYRDSIYYFTATINVNFPLGIIADSGSHRPPVIAPAILQDNSSPNGFMNVFSNTRNLTLRNLYFTGVRPDQNLIGWVSCISYSSDSTKSIYDNCVFESYGNAAIADNSGKYNKFSITDCKFRNLLHPTVWFGGQAFFANAGAPTDTVIMVNNTIFNSNSYANCNVDYNVYTRYEHNTVFLNCVNPLNDFVMTNAVYKNNIFYGTLAMAQKNAEIQQYFFENSVTPSSTFSFDLESTFSTSFPVSEADRKITVVNNSVFWPAKLKTFWTTALMDTLIPPVFLNARTTQMFTDKMSYPNLYIANNDTVNDPGFPASVLGQIDSVIQFVTVTREGTNTNWIWNYHPNGNLFAPVWPLPENLAYSNTTMQHQGSDGYALGDLNWFPAQKAAWLAAGLMSVNPATSRIPEAYTLSQNYPNPFNPSTSIEYNLPKASKVKLNVYNVLGQEVATLVNGTVTAGRHSVTFDASRLASGVYLYRIVADNYVSTMKMILLK